jgi:hypothetical protein
MLSFMFDKAYTIFDIFFQNIVAKPSIRPDIRFPAFGLAGYSAKTVSGASLLKRQYFQV